MKFYKHMSNMRHDPRIKRLISKFGIEGYGLYNIILESIVERIEDQRPVPMLQENCEDLADFYNGNTSKINEMVNFMVNQGLFEVEEFEGRILCSKIYKFLESNQTRSDHIRKLINLYKNNSESKLLSYDQASKTVSDICEEEKRRDKTRQDENTPQPVKDSVQLPDGTTVPIKVAITLPDGTNVPVNATTHQHLTTQHGQATVLDYYERIHDYSDSTGTKYKDYAATARNWLKRDSDKRPAEKTGYIPHYTTSEVDDDIRAMLRRNKEGNA